MHGTRDVLLFALQMVLGVVVPALIVKRDIRRLGPRELARAWPDASLWSAAAFAGVFAVLLHFLRTRRTFLGFLLGLGGFLLACLGVILPTAALELVLPE